MQISKSLATKGILSDRVYLLK